MRISKTNSIFAFAAALALTACAAPKVNVKKEWTRSIASYSFIPLYPMREDIFVGDIRIHRLDANLNSGLHSRPVARMATLNNWLNGESGYAPQYPKTTKTPQVTENQIRWEQNVGEKNIFASTSVNNRLRLMSLPGINVTRISHADGSATGIIGLWKRVIGTNFDSEETEFVSLTGLETMEIPDALIASDFLEKARNILSQKSSRLGICVSAISMGDPRFEKTAISVVTRVAYARGAEYRRKSERRVSVDVSVDSTDPNATNGAQGKANTEATTALTLNEVFDRPMAFGVDAMMLDPRVVFAGLTEVERAGHKTLAKACAVEAEGFAISPASHVLTGAIKRK